MFQFILPAEKCVCHQLVSPSAVCTDTLQLTARDGAELRPSSHGPANTSQAII